MDNDARREVGEGRTRKDDEDEDEDDEEGGLGRNRKKKKGLTERRTQFNTSQCFN